MTIVHLTYQHQHKLIITSGSARLLGKGECAEIRASGPDTHHKPQLQLQAFHENRIGSGVTWLCFLCDPSAGHLCNMGEQIEAVVCQSQLYSRCQIQLYFLPRLLRMKAHSQELPGKTI